MTRRHDSLPEEGNVHDPDKRTHTAHKASTTCDSDSSPVVQRSHKRRAQPVVERDLNVCGVVESKERASWYMCGVGSSIFGTFGMAFLIPFLLLNLLQIRAYAGTDIPPSCDASAVTRGEDWTVRCTREHGDTPGLCLLKNTGTGETAALHTRCTTCVVGIGNRIWGKSPVSGEWNLEEEKQDVRFFHKDVNYIAAGTWVLSIAVAVQVVVYISCGSFADYGNHRKRILLVCAVLGSLCVVLFMAAADKNADIAAAILIVLANVLYGMHLVAHNAYLPVLVDAHEKLCNVDVAALHKDEEEDLHTFRTEHESELSSKGYSFGYIGQAIGMMVCGAIIMLADKFYTKAQMRENCYFHFRLALLFVGLWWLLWSLPAMLWLNTRAAPPLFAGRGASCAVLTFGWRDTWMSLRLAATRRNTWLMIVIFFVYCDMYGTSNFLCILIASQRVCMKESRVFMLAMISVVMAVCGGYVTFFLQRTWNLSVKTLLVGCLVVYACLALCGVIGLWSTSFGFQTQWEMYLYAAIYGFLFSPIISYTRVLYSDFIPIGHESSFFSIYAILEKAPKLIGPVIIGIIVDSLDIRYTYLYLFPVAVASALVLHFGIDHEQGMADAGRLHESCAPPGHVQREDEPRVKTTFRETVDEESFSAVPI